MEVSGRKSPPFAKGAKDGAPSSTWDGRRKPRETREKGKPKTQAHTPCLGHPGAGREKKPKSTDKSVCATKGGEIGIEGRLRKRDGDDGG